MNADARAVLKQNLWSDNPIFMQLLGICSTLAVTNNIANTMIMTFGVAFVTAFSSFSVSLLKEFIPFKVRMITQTLIIAFYVIIVDLILRAYFPVASKTLGPYVGLIITNCIIMGRAEGFAQANPPLISFWDGLTSGFGYMAVLLVVAIIREPLGSGTFLNMPFLPEAFPRWSIMLSPSSAFFLLGIIIWLARSIMEKKSAAAKVPAGAKPAKA